ncbi:MULTISPECIES: hypothetical protein [unclassified Streptomyces]|uniref:hypothetical protein n=1 Tax=unclassified Streptomyces TaxID=2593676 RepID=UPI0036E9CB13
MPKSQQIKSLAGCWRIDQLIDEAPADAWQLLPQRLSGQPRARVGESALQALREGLPPALTQRPRPRGTSTFPRPFCPRCWPWSTSASAT